MRGDTDFWEFIQFRPGLKATASTWSRFFSPAAWNSIKKDIFRSVGISSEIFHHEYGVPLRIIKKRNDLYDAVCPASGEVVISNVPESEILNYQIILKAFCGKLCELFDFSKTNEFSVVQMEIIPVGVWKAVPGHNVTISLALLPSEQILRQKLLEFLSCDSSGPRIIFIPTGSDNGISADLYKKAEERKVLLLPLNQYVNIVSGGFELVADQWKEFQTRFLQKYYTEMLISKGPEYALIQKGDFWDLTFNGKTTHLQDSVGIKYVFQLLMVQGNKVSCSDLISLANGHDPIRIDETATEIAEKDDLKSYWKEYEELAGEIEEAKSNDNYVKVEQLQEEQGRLLEECEKIKGLGGKSRNFKTDLEKNRTSVTTALDRLKKRLKKALPDAAVHFHTYIKTGSFCRYCPQEPIEWEF